MNTFCAYQDSKPDRPARSPDTTLTTLLQVPPLSTVIYTASVSFHVPSHWLVISAARPSVRFPPTLGKRYTIIYLLGSCLEHWQICRSICGSTASDATQCEQREASLNNKQKLQQHLLKYHTNCEPEVKIVVRTTCVECSTGTVKQCKNVSEEWEWPNVCSGCMCTFTCDVTDKHGATAQSGPQTPITETHHRRQDSSAPAISPTQRPLPGNTKHS